MPDQSSLISQLPEPAIIFGMPLIFIAAGLIIYFIVSKVFPPQTKPKLPASKAPTVPAPRPNKMPAQEKVEAVKPAPTPPEKKPAVAKKPEEAKLEVEKPVAAKPAAEKPAAEKPPAKIPATTTTKATETPEPKTVMPEDVAAIKNLDQKTWFKKLSDGLRKSRDSLTTGITSIFSGQKPLLDDDSLEALHATLYKADVGVSTADYLIDSLKEAKSEIEAGSLDSVKQHLQNKIEEICQTSQKPLAKPENQNDPLVILIVGVNGVGKTTSIGKLAAHFLAEDKSVLLCAADTYRAAAIDQLQVWGERLGVDVIAQQPGSDPAAVAFDGVKAAKARKMDVLLIDTAGRLHSKKELMDELAKIKRVMKKELPDAPHETWIVIDATTGQNAFFQVKSFREVVDLSGIVVTKLDGTAKGGVAVGVTHQHNLPLRYIGVGEQANDLHTFSAKEYAAMLLN